MDALSFAELDLGLLKQKCETIIKFMASRQKICHLTCLAHDQSAKVRKQQNKRQSAYKSCCASTALFTLDEETSAHCQVDLLQQTWNIQDW